MVAYLALHRHEPVTGERLRTRVLASRRRGRVLAHPGQHRQRGPTQPRRRRRRSRAARRDVVGLYVTHGVTSDVENFDTLVARRARSPRGEAALLAREALPGAR